MIQNQIRIKTTTKTTTQTVSTMQCRPLSNQSQNEQKITRRKTKNLNSTDKLSSLNLILDSELKSEKQNDSFSEFPSMNENYEKQQKEKYQDIDTQEKNLFDHNKGNSILQKAKSLIKQKSAIIQKAKINQSYSIPKDNTYLTGVNIEEKEEQKQEPESDDEPQPEFDIDEYYKELLDKDKGSDYIDPLEELRKMIKQTKLTIEDYADEVYNLKNTVIDANFSFREAGKGIDENVFWEMSCQFQESMPDGDKKKIFQENMGNSKVSQLPPISSKNSSQKIQKQQNPERKKSASIAKTNSQINIGERVERTTSKNKLREAIKKQ